MFYVVHYAIPLLFHITCKQCWMSDCYWATIDMRVRTVAVTL